MYETIGFLFGTEEKRISDSCIYTYETPVSNYTGNVLGDEPGSPSQYSAWPNAGILQNTVFIPARNNNFHFATAFKSAVGGPEPPVLRVPRLFLHGKASQT